MKKCFFVICICVLFCSLISCNSKDDSYQVSLQSYSSIDHAFLNNMIDSFRTEENMATLAVGAEAPVGGAVGGGFKIFGAVAQIAGKVHTIKATNDFRTSVLSDLNVIKAGLKNLDTKITNGFNAIHGKLDSMTFAIIWNQLQTSHLDTLDTAWNRYLGSDTDSKLGLLDTLTAKDLTPEKIEIAVDIFINTDIKPRITDIENALTGIQNQITNYNNIDARILDLYVSVLSSNNGTTFDNKILMEDLLTQYLYMYSNLLLYQTKALILMAEYYNYNVIDESGKIRLNSIRYRTVTADRTKAMNKNAIHEFQKQLVPFLNSGERLISQFNSGDIYREYKTDSPSIRNSDFYPFLDTYIKTFYGIGAGYPLFVFRLAWSEEAATNDPDAENQYKEISGPYNYNYKVLFDDLKNAEKRLDFVLIDDNNIYYHPTINENPSKNLTSISTFPLHPQGYVDRTFNAGLRRFVFVDIPHFVNMRLSYTTDLTESYRFNYTPEGSKYFDFKLYDPKFIKSFFMNILDRNNTLRFIFYDYQVVSFTFGAYMAEFEYKNMYMFSKADPHSSEVSYLYNTSSEGQYFLAYQRLKYHNAQVYTEAFGQVDHRNYKAKFTIEPYDDTEVDDYTEIYDGMNVVLFGYDQKRSEPKTLGVGKYASGQHLRSNVDSYKKNFFIKKKYVFPSGKLFSDDVIKRHTFFMLTKNKGDDNAKDNLWVASKAAYAKDYCLELSKDGDFSMNTWFFLDDRTETVRY